MLDLLNPRLLFSLLSWMHKVPKIMDTKLPTSIPALLLLSIIRLHRSDYMELKDSSCYRETEHYGTSIIYFLQSIKLYNQLTIWLQDFYSIICIITLSSFIAKAAILNIISRLCITNSGLADT